MARFDGRTLATDEGHLLCLMGTREDGREGKRVDEMGGLISSGDAVVSAAAGLVGRQISIEAWARETFERELEDWLKPPVRRRYDDLMDEPGRETEMPDDGLVGGWLGMDDDLEDHPDGEA